MRRTGQRPVATGTVTGVAPGAVMRELALPANVPPRDGRYRSEVMPTPVAP